MHQKAIIVYTAELLGYITTIGHRKLLFNLSVQFISWSYTNHIIQSWNRFNLLNTVVNCKWSVLPHFSINCTSVYFHVLWRNKRATSQRRRLVTTEPKQIALIIIEFLLLNFFVFRFQGPASNYWYYDFPKLIFMIIYWIRKCLMNRRINYEWKVNLAECEARWWIANQPNASKCQTSMSLILCRLFAGANKMFIKYVPRWQDIYQRVNALLCIGILLLEKQRFLKGAAWL